MLDEGRLPGLVKAAARTHADERMGSGEQLIRSDTPTARAREKAAGYLTEADGGSAGAFRRGLARCSVETHRDG